MTHRIYRAICTVAIVVLLCALVLIMNLLYDYSRVRMNQMIESAQMAAHGVALSGRDYFKDIELEREEIREAMTKGIGESTRYSQTLTQASE